MKAKTKLFNILRLLWIWSIAAAITFGVIAIFYSWLIGWNKIVLNETIYKNYRFVGYPGASQWTANEGYGLTTYGNDGLIVNKSIDWNAKRILFIGDSWVKAAQISDASKFTEIVEHVWNQRHPDDRIQSLNLGLTGQDVSTYISFGQSFDAHFQPDLVFLMASQYDFRAASQKQLAMHFQDPTLPIVRPERTSFILTIVNELGLLSFMGQVLEQTYAYFEMKDAVQDAKGMAAEPVTQQLSAAQFHELLAQQLDALHAIWGDRLIIIYRTNIPNLGHDVSMQVEDDVLPVIKAYPIPTIDLYPAFLQAYHQHHPPVGFQNTILGTGHPNIIGNQIIAAEIIRYMEDANDLF